MAVMRLAEAKRLWARLPVTVVAVLLGATLLAACTEDAPPPPSTAETPPQPEAEPERAIVLEGRRLVEVDLAGGTATPLGHLPSRQATVASEDRVVYAASVDDDPTLQLAPLADPGDATEVGPGTDPVASPDGSLVAGVSEAEGSLVCPPREQGEEAPGDLEEAEEAGCVAGQRVAIYDLGQDLPQEGVYALGANLWQIVGWTDGDRVVGRSTIHETLWVGFPGAVFEEQLAAPWIRPEDVLALSPEGAEALVSHGDGVAVQTVQEEETEPRLAVELPADGAVGAAAWAPQDSHIAAGVVLEGRSELTVIDAEDGDTEILETFRGDIVEIVWSAGGSHVAVLTRPARDRFQVTVCAREGDCRRVHAGTGLARLLALL